MKSLGAVNLSCAFQSSCAMAGLLFEEIAHEALARPNNIHVMKLLSDRSVTADLQMPQDLPIYIFEDNELASLIADFKGGHQSRKYLRPANSRFRAVDSIMLPNTLFQMTVSSHKPSPDIGDLITLLETGQPIPCSINMVYVVPEAIVDKFTASKYTGTLSGNVKQYVLGLSPRH
jgi:hypothetical protein